MANFELFNLTDGLDFNNSIMELLKMYRILIRFAIPCHYDSHLFLNGLLLNDVCVYNFVELEENSIPMRWYSTMTKL